ncbi:MAG: heme o synthase [Armatimonadota bacterium]
MARVQFHQFTWGLLAYNVAVILGGAFVRATLSGDGCGNHWPQCDGQLLPDLGQAKRAIEFAHRMSTGVLLPLVIAMVVWAFRAFPKQHPVRAGAVGVLLLTIVEALIGAGLVLFGWVAKDVSVARAIVMPAHLVTTFFLLMCNAVTAWWASGAPHMRLKGQGAMAWALGFGLLVALLLGISGAITALGDTVFPDASHADAFSPSAHFLVSLRIYHPLFAISVGLYLVLVAALAMHLRPDPRVQQMARLAVLLYATQLVAGLMNYALKAPVWMQLVHLLLADGFWVALVLMSAGALGEGVERVELSRAWATDSAGVPIPEMKKAGWRDYLALTKPRVISLLLLTTVAAMFIAAGEETAVTPTFGLCLAVAAGLYMAAGAANAINMVLERDLDLRMGRTATRPTVTEAVPARSALQFAMLLAVGSFALLWLVANLLTAVLALAGLAFYVVVYTLLLKRRTWYNIVIGGAAGAFPPLVGWAAISGELSPLAWCLFGIIFLWTPVHFWALALIIKDDYARAGVPMLPVVRGDRATVVQIGWYALLTVAISILPMVLPGHAGRASVGWLYLGIAVLLNGVLLQQSFRLYRSPDRDRARSLFKYSMVYLALLFVAMAVDRATLI